MAVVAVVVGVVLRWWPRSALWLDEAQSVAIARFPLADIFGVLRTDGAPPLYYVVLHLWMDLWGRGDNAVRALSALLSTATLPVVGALAHAIGGRRAVAPTLVVLALNPFAIRYASETRMYALVAFIVAVGLWLLLRLFASPTWRRAAPVALAAAALLYSHYWALYLLGVGATAGALVAAFSGIARRRLAARWALAAGVAAGVLWLPWVPSFLYQAAHTATPWTAPPGWVRVLDIVSVHSGGHTRTAVALTALAWALLLAAVLPAHRSVASMLGPLDRGDGVTVLRCLVAVFFAGNFVAVLGAQVSGSAFASRYTMVFLVLFALATGGAVARLRRHGLQLVALGAVGALSVVLTVEEISRDRTPAVNIARELSERAAPGDIVAFCPDQVGPAIYRELGPDVRSRLALVTYPESTSPERVDWVDYERRYKEGSPSRFAGQLLSFAQPSGGTVWLVWSPDYPPTTSACLTLRRVLRQRNNLEQTVVADAPGRYADHSGLFRYPTAGSS